MVCTRERERERERGRGGGGREEVNNEGKINDRRKIIKSWII